MTGRDEISPKFYGIAVALCGGVFGTLGIHHFYLKDYLHGLADLALVVLFFTFLSQDMVGTALLTLLIDGGVHTVFVFYLLIIGKWRDGDGLRVATPTGAYE